MLTQIIYDLYRTQMVFLWKKKIFFLWKKNIFFLWKKKTYVLCRSYIIYTDHISSIQIIYDLYRSYMVIYEFFNFLCQNFNFFLFLILTQGINRATMDRLYALFKIFFRTHFFQHFLFDLIIFIQAYPCLIMISRCLKKVF